MRIQWVIGNREAPVERGVSGGEAGGRGRAQISDATACQAPGRAESMGVEVLTQARDQLLWKSSVVDYRNDQRTAFYAVRLDLELSCCSPG